MKITIEVPMKQVDSSAIKEIGHIQDKLVVKFNSDDVYIYDNVKKELYEELLKAESKGKFFHKNIKKADYTFTKLSIIYH